MRVLVTSHKFSRFEVDGSTVDGKIVEDFEFALAFLPEGLTDADRVMVDLMSKAQANLTTVNIEVTV